MLLLIYLFCVFICIIPASNSSLGNCWLGNWWLLQIWDWDWSVSPYGQFNHLWQQWQCCRNLLVCHTPVFPPTCLLLDPPLSSFVVCVWFLSFLCVEIEHEVSLNMNTKHHMVMKLRHKFGVACSQFRRAQSPFTFSLFNYGKQNAIK